MRQLIDLPTSLALFAAMSLGSLHPNFVAAAQQLENPIAMRLETQPCVVLESQAKACKDDYLVSGKNLEAISFRPAGEGRFPGILLVPGYQRTARDLVPLGARLANAGFAALAISQPGFGKSDGPPDFVGPNTIAALTAGYRKLQQQPFVDPARMGIYGYSRGGM